MSCLGLWTLNSTTYSSLAAGQAVYAMPTQQDATQGSIPLALQTLFYKACSPCPSLLCSAAPARLGIPPAAARDLLHTCITAPHFCGRCQSSTILGPHASSHCASSGIGLCPGPADAAKLRPASGHPWSDAEAWGGAVQLQFGDMSVSTKDLTRSFGWDYHDAFMQHDVQELNRVLVEKLEERMKACPELPCTHTWALQPSASGMLAVRGEAASC